MCAATEMQVRINATGRVYDLGGPLGEVEVLGLADTGVAQDSYDDCYQVRGCGGGGWGWGWG